MCKTFKRLLECKCGKTYDVEVDYEGALVQRFTCPDCGKVTPVIVMPSGED